MSQARSTTQRYQIQGIDRPGVLRTHQLERVVMAALGYRYGERGWGAAQARVIVDTIIESMRAALERRESVSVRGWGTLRVVPRRHRRTMYRWGPPRRHWRVAWRPCLDVLAACGRPCLGRPGGRRGVQAVGRRREVTFDAAMTGIARLVEGRGWVSMWDVQRELHVGSPGAERLVWRMERAGLVTVAPSGRTFAPTELLALAQHKARSVV